MGKRMVRTAVHPTQPDPGQLTPYFPIFRKIGLEARRKFVQPIGAWFSQVGELHQVIHMWHYEVRSKVY